MNDWDNYDYVLNAVTAYSALFECASKRLRGNETIAMIAISRNTYMMHDVSNELHTNKKFVLAVINIYHRAYLHYKCYKVIWRLI